LAVPCESLRIAACCGRLGDPEGGPIAVTSECVVNGLSSTGVATPPWLDTLECDVVFVMAGRQNACKHYHNTMYETMINLVITTLFSWRSLSTLPLLDKLKYSHRIKRKFFTWKGEYHHNLTTKYKLCHYNEICWILS
jgi:hypothetical protein